ncbi:MAG TPA: TolC family protein [Longimicrobium sp.]|nr:TolC family protein [Longimicrobium sp.]
MPISRSFRRAPFGAAALAALLGAAPLAAQQTPARPAAAGVRTLSLDEALRMAEAASEQITISRAGITRSRGEQLRARSNRYPQINGSASYTRALASEFESVGGGGSDTTSAPPPRTDCGTFSPNPALPIEARLDSLEKAVDCAASANPFAAFSDLPFGRENTWRLGVDVSQNLFTGGRIRGLNEVADAGRRTADIELSAQRAQLVLDITQAYYDAVLADRLVSIAEATLRQAEATLSQTRLARQVGNQPEFELLRAEVTFQNQRPVVIQRRAERDLAYTRIRLLLDLPPDQPVELVTPLNDAAPIPVGRFASDPERLGDTTTANRAPVRQAAEAVRQQEGLLRVARSQRLPQLSLFSQYARVGYPQTGTIPTWDEFRTNWNVGAQMSVPIFTGGRLRGDRLVAEANLSEARARLDQAVTLAQLDTRTAVQQLAAARASWEASAGTVEQAERAYSIAEIRYREGLSTQTELSESRILLRQAQANRAQAARDLQIAQVRVALLPDLPLNTGGAGFGTQQQFQQQPQQQQPRQTQPQQQPGGQTSSAFTGAGGQQ